MRAVLHYISGILTAVAVVIAAVVLVILPDIGRSPESTEPAPAQTAERGLLLRETMTAPIRARDYARFYRETSLNIERRSLTYGGRERVYNVYNGAGPQAGPAPVVILLHEARRTGLSMIDMWRDTALANGLILLAPNALGEGWSLKEDGLAFLLATLDDAAGRNLIDRRRVYLFGHASGGVFALLLANWLDGPWRAVGAHSASLGGNRTREEGPDRPEIVIFSGSRDRSFPPARVARSAEALAEAGHAVTLVEIPGHTHWFYDIGPFIADRAWAFFRRR